ncbi:uncharacterized protein PADG_11615 [Paracoccidioides brasiliensis Pb18]|uniref:Uncharacterized protein n=1 Tax=Paracoccidioides brasiliensis (strain Pb18) TaxID=502780 RepID=A0A0A0HXE7_PARBD|nr:uncharacterized protein PADG_11615 [Paracoccidioides brasiliensis Pb18]KGM92085.1 hypothetical protein PADG_11615 [Paracoccidioides brasiliensis Pb18]
MALHRHQSSLEKPSGSVFSRIWLNTNGFGDPDDMQDDEIVLEPDSADGPFVPTETWCPSPSETLFPAVLDVVQYKDVQQKVLSKLKKKSSKIRGLCR